MKKLKVFLFFFTFLILSINSNADMPYHLDFKFILNNSVAGKKAQDNLQKRLKDGIKSLNTKEKSLQEEEKNDRTKKSNFPRRIYKKVSDLRKKVSSLQTERKNLLEKISKDRSKARTELLKNLNPIIKEYMQEKQIRLVIDKKNIILADEKLDITDDIMKALNAKLKSIKLN